MQKLGQHFLKNQGVVTKTIEALELGDGDTIIEIGPGRGALTIPLEERCVIKNAQLIAIEKDRALAAELVKGLANRKNFNIVEGDVLDVLPSLIGDRKQKISSYKIIGNLPYYLTGHLLRIVGELKPRPERCVFMVQKEVAERIIAQPPEMNRLAASIQFWSEPRIIARVSRKDFSPPPKIDSVVIVLKTKTENFSEGARRYYAVMRALFAQPRKTIINNLAGAGNKKDLAEKLLHIGINPVLRPQNLSIGDIIAISNTDIEIESQQKEL